MLPLHHTPMRTPRVRDNPWTNYGTISLHREIPNDKAVPTRYRRCLCHSFGTESMANSGTRTRGRTLGLLFVGQTLIPAELYEYISGPTRGTYGSKLFHHLRR